MRKSRNFFEIMPNFIAANHLQTINIMAKSNFWSDFKEFAVKGNVVDMAVGVIVGGAFGKIVSSLVNDILMPCIGWLIGGVDFTKLSIELKGTLASKVADGAESLGGDLGGATAVLAESANNSVMLNYGNFIQQTVDFIIIALCIFLVLRALTIKDRRKKAAEEAAAAEKAAEPAPKSDDVVLLEEIRDLLKNQK